MIKLENINHVYNNKKISYQALYDVSIEIPENKFVILLGQSGSGKTTLLNITAGLLKPTNGRVLYNENDIYNNKMDLCEFRKENIGFVFQNFYLEKSFTAFENVLVPLFLNDKMSNKERYEKVDELLTLVNLYNVKNHKPTELSGGECQRLSIARALANNPKIIIADEPTGNLDSNNGIKIVNILKDQVKKGKTVIMVTHNEEYIKYSDLTIKIKDGRII